MDLSLGEWLTNILSINDVTRIHFTRLENSAPSSATSLALVAAEWREEGCLVFYEVGKAAIWLFGFDDGSNSLLPSSAVQRQGEVVRVQGLDLIIKQDALQTCETIKSAKQNATPAPASSNSNSNSNFNQLQTEDILHHQRGINYEAIHNNEAIPKQIVSEDLITETTATLQQSDEDILEPFLSAVLAGISYRLCRSGGYIPLNARTLVVSDIARLAPGDCYPHDTSQIITIDLDMTAFGVLILKARLSTSIYVSHALQSTKGGHHLSEIPKGSSLFLGPGGRVAKFIGLLPNQEHGSTPSAEGVPEESEPAEGFHMRNSIKHWKRRCLTWLARTGLETDAIDKAGWMMVQVALQLPTSVVATPEIHENANFTESLVTIPWPAMLCFRATILAQEKDSSLGQVHDYDPLDFAQAWYSTKVDRDATVDRRNKEKDAVEVANKAQMELDCRPSSSNTYSPLTLRRASTAGMVYPTPPDGVQHTIGATPSFDGNVSTPGQPNQHALSADAEVSMLNKNDQELETRLWEPPGPKRDQPNTNLEFNNNSNEHLFGEMGDDLFGENDITDADFSFFDEPDIPRHSSPKVASGNIEQDNQMDFLSDIKPETPGNQSLGDDRLTSDIPITNADSFMVPIPHIENTSSSPPIVEVRVHDVTSDELCVPHDSPRNTRPQSPPTSLNPELVFKRLSIAASAQKQIARLDEKGFPFREQFGMFRGIDFEKSLWSFDEKYASDGRFFSPLSPPQKAATVRPKRELPSTGYLHRKRQRRMHSQDFTAITMISNEDLAVSEPVNHWNNSDLANGIRRNSQQSSSDQDDTDSNDGNRHEVFSNGTKRKLQDIEEDIFQPMQEENSSSFQILGMKDGSSPLDHNILDSLSLDFFTSDPSDWVLAKLLTFAEPHSHQHVLNDDDLVSVAQILVDQQVSRTSRKPGIRSLTTLDVENDESEDKGLSVVQQDLLLAALKYFEDVTQCDLRSFLTIVGTPLTGPISRAPVPAKPMFIARGQADRTNIPAPLPTPHLLVHRYDSKLSVLPSAIPFWDTLGLGPSLGGKEVNALCLFPDLEGMAGNAKAFLDNMQSAYESCRLGTHRKFSTELFTEGLVPMYMSGPPTPLASDHTLQVLRDKCALVGNQLAYCDVHDSNLVVYFVYDEKRPEIMVSICAAFHHMFEIYKEVNNERKLSTSNELVLQLVPLEFIASHISMVVPTPSQYATLAMEVYDRCIELKTGSFSPAIVLEPRLPKFLEFSLSPNPSPALLAENSHLHVAYAQTIDDRWVTAAWTDGTGAQQMTSSYCLGRKGNPLTRVFSDIAHEIWETTLDLIALKDVKWRVNIVKCGVMFPSEMEFWKGLASTESKAKLALTLISVDTQPSLQLAPPSALSPPSNLASQSTFYTTPVSTPQASIVSPEQSGNVSTPARDSGNINAATPGDSTAEPKMEADATLVDLRDRGWGAISSHKINNSNTLLEVHPALVSGYLIKSTGTTSSDVPVIMEVNILHTEFDRRIHEALMMDLLTTYKSFATLSRVRGISNPLRDARPWHIAAAEKGVELLYKLL